MVNGCVLFVVGGSDDEEDSGPHGCEGGHDGFWSFGGSIDGQQDDVDTIIHRRKDGRHQGS